MNPHQRRLRRTNLIACIRCGKRAGYDGLCEACRADADAERIRRTERVEVVDLEDGRHGVEHLTTYTCTICGQVILDLDTITLGSPESITCGPCRTGDSDV